MSVSDFDIERAVNQVFDKYDLDQNSFLENREVIVLINDTLKSMGRERKANLVEAKEFI